MYSTAVLKIDSTSKIPENWLKIPRNSAIFGQNSANFRQFTRINFNLFHYAGNNPVKYLDPDGRLDITSFYIPDFCSLINGTENKLAVPLGGNLTSEQKDISKIQDLVTLGFSRVADLGNFASVFDSDFSVDTAISLVKTTMGIISEAADIAISYIDLLTIISSEPDLAAKNYSKDKVDFIAKCSIEQMFIKDFSAALTKKRHL